MITYDSTTTDTTNDENADNSSVDGAGANDVDILVNATLQITSCSVLEAYFFAEFWCTLLSLGRYNLGKHAKLLMALLKNM